MKSATPHKIMRINILAVCLILISATPLWALEIRSGDLVTIAANEVIEDDLFIGANVLIIEGTIRGDVIFGGTTIVVNGTVEGDLMGGGQTLTINGTVTDDVRFGGTTLTLGEGGSIGDDLLMGGFALETTAGSRVGGQVYFGGAGARLAGHVDRDVFASAGGLEILGTVSGDVTAQVGAASDRLRFNPAQFIPNAPAMPTVPTGLTVGDDASIGGNLNYSSPQEFEIPASVTTGTTNFERTEAEPSNPFDPFTLLGGSIGRLIAFLLVALLLVWLLAPLIRRSGTALRLHFGASLGWGAVAAIAIPIALLIFVGLIIMLAVIFGALSLGQIGSLITGLSIFALVTIILTLFLLFVFVSKIIVAYWLGRLIFRTMENMVLPLLVGLIIVVILVSIPYVGGLLSALIGLLGLGGIIVARTRAELGNRSTTNV